MLGVDVITQSCHMSVATLQLVTVCAALQFTVLLAIIYQNPTLTNLFTVLYHLSAFACMLSMHDHWYP